MERLLVVGAGGHGRSVAEAVAASGAFIVAGFLDDAFPELERVWEVPVLGKVSELARFRDAADHACVAIGNNALRRRVTVELRDAGFVLATVIHPRAIVSPTAMIGAGSAIMAGAIVGTEARLGDGVIVNCAAVVDHHCRVGDFGHLGVNAAMAGGAVLGASAWMQAGSALGYGVEIEDGGVLMPGEAVGR
ncbi:MAG: NeuD/PglB/VioB family sugar acetyltransferase [Dechloromonas sp.]|uniref:NeuD/PglB/VioB family sugar acetyltransferase n=1 Tax=Candidatus Dechloromonas phosphorivorans TaxID=2899244 RepID=A0A9D7LYD7_9RHOO|nr:NeuD/PglB/VioB family sugar acetyltransferase [Candidatus Dechloromonas phosphorivorans]